MRPGDNASEEGPAGAIPDTFTTTIPIASNPQTKIYYRAYATNSVDTSYSPQGSFYTEPDTAATGLSFPAFDSISMTISWTPGSGDGSLVVMRAGSAPEVPSDGTVYTPNTVFGSGGLIGADSRVVATSGSSVDVTGLASGTTYFVAIYQYAGTVADSGLDQGINYNQAPLSGSQATDAISAPTVIDPTAVEGRGAAHHPVNLIILVEQELSEVRTVLAGDAGDQGFLHGAEDSRGTNAPQFSILNSQFSIPGLEFLPGARIPPGRQLRIAN